MSKSVWFLSKSGPNGVVVQCHVVLENKIVGGNAIWLSRNAMVKCLRHVPVIRQHVWRWVSRPVDYGASVYKVDVPHRPAGPNGLLGQLVLLLVVVEWDTETGHVMVKTVRDHHSNKENVMKNHVMLDVQDSAMFYSWYIRRHIRHLTAHSTTSKESSLVYHNNVISKEIVWIT